VSLRIGETLKTKHAFEALMKEHGFAVEEYLTDNAPFHAAEFLRDIKNNGQKIKYSGVGAHHQNCKAERSIRTVSQWARAMLLHHTLHWPEETRLDVWPFALDQSVYLWNNMPDRRTRLAPIELFTGVKFLNYRHLQRAHVWGSPMYVLDPKLQDGKKLPKWTPRARCALYVGVSPDHSSTVGRVLNLQTGYVSPQYHCVYDDHFSTVNCPVDNVFEGEQFTRQSWERLLELG
jgi:hypothetical protein